MKKEVIILIILIFIISGCSLISEVGKKAIGIDLRNDTEKKEIVKVPEDELIGPGGCEGKECDMYCKQNQNECRQWCEENFDKCKELCDKKIIPCPEEHSSIFPQGGFPGGFGKGFTGPGGCTGPDCATVCSTQPEVCQQWCEQNPQMCAMFMGGGSDVVEPPATIITFAKTVNFNADQFTEQDISKAKELGANMVTIWPARFIRNDEFIFSLPERLAPMINFAHKNGLQVELRSSFAGEQITNYDKFRTNAIKHVADFAKFAEKNKVYRIVPFGEIDNNMLNQCDKITELAKELLTEMRKHYSGQIGVGIAAPWRDCGYTFTGYDYMTISAYAQAKTGTDAWLTTSPEINVHNVISGARKVADRSSIKILHVGETGVINPDDTKREDAESFATENKEKEAEYYQKFFGQVSDRVNGLSVFYNSKMDYMSINGDPAEKIVKEWYKKLYPEEKSQPQPHQQQSGIPSCDDKKEFFTVSHIPISELQNIVPLGNLNPSGHTFPTNHLYFHLKGFSGDESSSNAPVIAPGDIWITRISSSEYTMKGRQIKDYKLDFRVCTEVRGYFIHITSLSEKLLQNLGQSANCKEYNTGGIDYKNCEKDFYFSPISVAAGEPIGTVGGSSDFGLADLRTQELVYANPKRWYEDPLHRVCPLDYFTANIGAQLKSLLGSSNSKRTVEPVCGEVAQDKPGTAQGVWFVKGTSNTYPEDPHLALVHDNIDPEKGVFSIGTSINGLSSGAYSFNPASSGLVNRDFKDITADGKVYCYEAQGGRPYTQYVAIILQLTSPTTLRIGKQNSNNCGNSPWAFSSNYVDFER